MCSNHPAMVELESKRQASGDTVCASSYPEEWVSKGQAPRNAVYSSSALKEWSSKE